MKKKKFQQLPVWMLVAIDAVVLGLALIAFALYDHAWPRSMETEVSPETLALIEQIQARREAQEDMELVIPLSAKFPEKFTDGAPYWEGDTYVGRNMRVELISGTFEGSTYYAQDIYVRDMECMRTAFAEDTYGRGYSESLDEMASRTGAIGAMNGDFYYTGSLTVIIRNGVLYRDAVDPLESVCVMFKDGSMEVYEAGRFTVSDLVARGAWQTWSFGPNLLDAAGQPFSEYVTDDNSGRHPRSVIGMVEPGHFVFLTVDGRQTGYSEGLNYPNLAALCKQLGMTVAYNLDGGATARMYYRDHTVNRPSKDRSLSDIVYVIDVDK